MPLFSEMTFHRFLYLFYVLGQSAVQSEDILAMIYLAAESGMSTMN